MATYRDFYDDNPSKNPLHLQVLPTAFNSKSWGKDFPNCSRDLRGMYSWNGKV